MNFQYNYNLSGSARKPLVETISQMLGKPAIYQGAPSFSYIVGNYTIDRNGVLSCGSNIQPEIVETLVEALQERGFTPVALNTAAIVTEDATEENVASEATENAAESMSQTSTTNTPNDFTVEIPDVGFTPEARENLKKIVASKKTILKKALAADDLPIIEKDGKIAFPWFTLHGLEGEADSYSSLVAAICNMAKNQRRVTAVEKPEENAKYAMRLFLVRLGFIGNEYKTARKILLRNLTGNSSWKSGHKPDQLSESTESAESTAVTANEETEFQEHNNKGGADDGEQ